MYTIILKLFNKINNQNVTKNTNSDDLRTDGAVVGRSPSLLSDQDSLGGCAHATATNRSRHHPPHAPTRTPLSLSTSHCHAGPTVARP
jgi:hypothetical protein